MRLPIVFLGLLLFFAGTNAARAQHVRSGFWMGAGAGYARTAVDCEPCTLDREPVSGLFLRIGNSPTRRVTVGGELNFLRTDQDSVYASVLTVMAVARFYPIDAAGLYINTGIGLHRSRFEYLTAPPGLRDIEIRATGVQIGTGYEIPLLDNLFLTPFLLFVSDYGNSNTKHNGNRIAEASKPNFYQFGIGLTWH